MSRSGYSGKVSTEESALSYLEPDRRSDGMAQNRQDPDRNIAKIFHSLKARIVEEKGLHRDEALQTLREIFWVLSWPRRGTEFRPSNRPRRSCFPTKLGALLLHVKNAPELPAALACVVITATATERERPMGALPRATMLAEYFDLNPFIGIGEEQSTPLAKTYWILSVRGSRFWVGTWNPCEKTLWVPVAHDTHSEVSSFDLSNAVGAYVLQQVIDLIVKGGQHPRFATRERLRLRCPGQFEWARLERTWG